MPKGRKSNGRKGSRQSTDALIIASHKPTGSTTSVCRSDLVFRRQNFNLVQTPPRQLSNQIFWTQLSSDTQLNASNLTITETNFSFGISGFGGFSSLLAAFDQYCIYSIVCTFSSNANVSTPIRLHTALDYDSVANLGSKILLQAYGTYEFFSISGGGSTSAIRYLKPTIAPQVTSSGVPVPGGIGRTWIDSGYNSVTHYGLRTIVDTYVGSTTGLVEVSFSAICGFRNAI